MTFDDHETGGLVYLLTNPTNSCFRLLLYSMRRCFGPSLPPELHLSRGAAVPGASAPASGVRCSGATAAASAAS